MDRQTPESQPKTHKIIRARQEQQATKGQTDEQEEWL